jgi:hypothetical protein
VRFLLDEMFPTTAAIRLGDPLGHDAVHVTNLGLGGAADPELAAVARAQQRVLVTENVVDFAPETDLVLVCVLKRNLPAGRGQAHALAELLDRWAVANPKPYLGQHWPS